MWNCSVLKPFFSLCLVVVETVSILRFFLQILQRWSKNIVTSHWPSDWCFPCSTFLLENFMAVILINFFTTLLKARNNYMEVLSRRRGLMSRHPKCLAVATAALSWGSAEAMWGAGCKAESFPADCLLNWLFIFKLFWSFQQILLYTAVEVKY